MKKLLVVIVVLLAANRLSCATAKPSQEISMKDAPPCAQLLAMATYWAKEAKITFEFSPECSVKDVDRNGSEDYVVFLSSGKTQTLSNFDQAQEYYGNYLFKKKHLQDVIAIQLAAASLHTKGMGLKDQLYILVDRKPPTSYWLFFQIDIPKSAQCLQKSGDEITRCIGSILDNNHVLGEGEDPLK